MLDVELRGALRLELGEVAEVVVEALCTAAVETRPERRFGDRGALGVGHALVVVRGPRDHVDVRVDVLHGYSILCPCRHLRHWLSRRAARTSTPQSHAHCTLQDTTITRGKIPLRISTGHGEAADLIAVERLHYNRPESGFCNPSVF